MHIADWHDYFLVIATVAATLIGLQFVAISIVASYMSKGLQVGLHVFITPTIFHFAVAMAACLVVLVPDIGLNARGALLLVVGAVGASAAGWVFTQIFRRFREDVGIDDKLLYAIAPLACHLVTIAAAITLLLHHPRGIFILAAAVLLLVLVCIRNAWDISVWAVMRSREGA